MRNTNLILSAAVLGLSSFGAQAATLYSATAPRTVDGSAVPAAEVYSLSAGTSSHIMFDDAFIDRGPLTNTHLALDNVKIGLIHGPLASATTVKVFLAPMLDNTAVAQGGNLGNDPDGGSDAAPDVGTPIEIYSGAYAGNVNAQAIDEVLDIPVSQVLAGYQGYAGKLGFFIGVQFTNDDASNGWALAQTDIPALFPEVYSTFDYGTNTGGPKIGYNLDVAWDYLSGTNSDEFAVLPATDAYGDLNSTFYAGASGVLVPEPTSLGLILAGGMLMLRRNRRA